MKRLFLLFISSLFLLSFINAGSIGISPAKQSFIFDPYISKNFTFSVAAADPSQSIGLYVKGDLSEYVALSKKIILGNGSFDVIINLPNEIEIPGNHRILVGAGEINKDYGDSMGGVAAIQAPIDIFVPYPGKYAEAEFEIEDINEGEDAQYKLIIKNLGTDQIDVKSKIEFSRKGDVVLLNELEKVFIPSKESRIFNGNLSTGNFSSGEYNFSAEVDYGEKIIFNKIFRVGTLFVNITDYSYLFKPFKINKFWIEVESLWNSEIEDVYGLVTFTNNGTVVDSLKTPSITLSPWQKVNLTGFFDASDLPEGKYRANMRVYYGDEVAQKLVAVTIKGDPLVPNYKLIIALILGGIIFSIAIFIIVYLLIKIRSLKRSIKKNGKK